MARREFWDEIHRLAAEGLTVLVSTHYMDEAERCHAIAYIAYGWLMAKGTVDEVIGRSGLVTWTVIGSGLDRIARALAEDSRVVTVAAFGTTLHVSGTDRDALAAALAPLRADPSLRLEPGEATLEDVFILLMRQSRAELRAA